MTTTPQADAITLRLHDLRDETVYAKELLVRELKELRTRCDMELKVLQDGYAPEMAGHFAPQALKVEIAQEQHRAAWKSVHIVEHLESIPSHP